MYLHKRRKRRCGKEHPSSSLPSPRPFFFCVHADPVLLLNLSGSRRFLFQCAPSFSSLPLCPVLQEQQEQFDEGALVKSLRINSWLSNVRQKSQTLCVPLKCREQKHQSSCVPPSDTSCSSHTFIHNKENFSGAKCHYSGFWRCSKKYNLTYQHV